VAVVLVEFVAGLAGADRLPLTLGSGVDGDDSFGTAGVTAVGFSGVTVPGLVGLWLSLVVFYTNLMNIMSFQAVKSLVRACFSKNRHTKTTRWSRSKLTQRMDSPTCIRLVFFSLAFSFPRE